ncbi:MAG: hypothetical protein ACJAZG_002002 [Granulosicoccus sp.]|jgi:hypothetical protein
MKKLTKRIISLATLTFPEIFNNNFSLLFLKILINKMKRIITRIARIKFGIISNPLSNHVWSFVYNLFSASSRLLVFTAFELRIVDTYQY